jgi:uncharacterized protein (TIGR02266 family)
MVDLRKDKRAAASLKVKYKSATVDEFVEQFGTDVSRGGIFVKTKKPIEIGALLKLELQLSNASPVIHGVGRVCWRREPGPDPNWPAGMGIKFIKLDPDSRAVVERIVQHRGGRLSRFDQTQGAELATPSGAPPAVAAPVVAGEGSVEKVAAAAAARLGAPPVPAATVRTPGPAPRAGASSAVPAVPRASGPSPMAGLFAHSPTTRNPQPEPSSEPTSRSSFFPPARGPNGTGSARPAAQGSVGSGKLTPPPVAVGAPASKSAPPVGVPPARADHARQSGQFLAAAFAEAGVAEATATQARAAADSSEDALIDELFAGVVSEPVRSSKAVGGAQAPVPAKSGSVDDVFAALSEEEGLSERPTGKYVSPPFGPRSSPGVAAIARESPPAASPRRAGEPDSVDELLSELGAESSLGHASSPQGSSFGIAPEPMDDADSRTEPDPQEDELGDELNDEFGEADLFGSSGEPASAPGLAEDAQNAAAIARASSPGAAPLSLQLGLEETAPAKRSGTVLPWIVGLLLLVVGGGGGFVYYQRSLAPRPEAVQAAPRPAAGPAPAAAAQPREPAAVNPQDPTAKPEAAVGTAVAAPTVEIEVSSLPRDSDIAIDGARVGTTPKHVVLPIGREARVTVSTAGYASMTKTVVADANTEPLRFRLEPLPYALVVRTNPSQAELSVGQRTATSPEPLELGHLDGGVQVSVAKEGYQRMTRLVRIDEFSEKDGVMRAEVEVTLNPLPGAAAAASRTKRVRVKPEAPPAATAPGARAAPPAPPEPPGDTAPSGPAPLAPEPM